MKRVIREQLKFPHALKVEKNHACPSCGARTIVFASGAIYCVAQEISFEPEVSDGELWSMNESYRKALEADTQPLPPLTI